jgi:hypothetical protein
MKRYLFVLVLSMTALASFSQAKISAVESVLLYSAIKYMDWPVDPSEYFVITILGDSDVYDELLKIAQTRKAAGKSILVKRISSLPQLEKSQIIFLSQGNTNLLDKVIASVSNFPSLIITDKDGLMEKGSDLNIIQRGEKIGYQVNESSLSKKGIKVSNAFVNMAEKTI